MIQTLVRSAPNWLGAAVGCVLATAEINRDQQHAASAELNRILNDLEQVHRAIRNLSATTDFVKRQAHLLPVTDPVEMKFMMKAVVDSGGNVRRDTEGQQVNIEPDGKSVRLYDGRWVTAYRHKEIRGMPAGEARRLEWYEGRPSGASLDNHPTWHGIDPREFTTHYQQSLVTKILRDRGASRSTNRPSRPRRSKYLPSGPDLSGWRTTKRSPKNWLAAKTPAMRPVSRSCCPSA